MTAFSYYETGNGKLAELDRKYPSYLSAWNGDSVELAEGDTHFGYCHKGTAMLTYDGTVFPIREKSYFCTPGAGHLESRGGTGIIVSREQYKGFFFIGGVIERKGRLKYIDGCTDSLLVSPVAMGDPCLNLLYFPPGVFQTMHTHPSDRIGMVLSGRGRCHTREAETIELEEGMIFCIHAGGEHNFSTPYDDELRVLAYHPESDFGPTDENHPMINRTIINGVSASELRRVG